MSRLETRARFAISSVLVSSYPCLMKALIAASRMRRSAVPLLRPLAVEESVIGLKLRPGAGRRIAWSSSSDIEWTAVPEKTRNHGRITRRSHAADGGVERGRRDRADASQVRRLVLEQGRRHAGERCRPRRQSTPAGAFVRGEARLWLAVG